MSNKITSKDYILKEVLPFSKSLMSSRFDSKSYSLYQGFLQAGVENKVIKYMDYDYYLKKWGKEELDIRIEDNKKQQVEYSDEFINTYRDISFLPIEKLVKRKPKWAKSISNYETKKIKKYKLEREVVK